MWVERFRLQKCWSQEKVAEMTGLSVRTIQRLDNGQPASMDSQKALASVFDVDANDLQREHPMTIDHSTPADPTAHAAEVDPKERIAREEEQAIEYVEHAKGFYVHLLIFLIVMPALGVLNFFISPHMLWFHYVLIPWLLAFALQAVLTFPVFELFGPEWEKRQVEERLGRKIQLGHLPGDSSLRMDESHQPRRVEGRGATGRRTRRRGDESSQQKGVMGRVDGVESLPARSKTFRFAAASALAAGLLPIAARLAASQNVDLLYLTVDNSQPLAVMAIADARLRGERPTADDWQRLEASAGYRRWLERQRSIGYPVDEEGFRAFVQSAELREKIDPLRAKVAEWSALDPVAAGAMAAAYLPAGTPLRATVYPLIKRSHNTFVYDLKADPAIFFAINVSETAAAFANTLAHELHHVGVVNACSGDESESLPKTSAAATKWLSAFSEGRAMLAAAGDSETHPHASSPADDRRQWDSDMGKVSSDILRVEAFFTSLLDGDLTEDEVTQRGMAFINDEGRPQGPFYTLGWLMASTVERELGRDRLIASTCAPEQLLLDYDKALRQRDGRGETSVAMPRWSRGFLERLQDIARPTNGNRPATTPTAQ